jgi:two-component system, OmpR family, response regulator VicR
MNKGKILLVEDDTNLAFVIKDNLEINGFLVTLALDGEIAFTEFKKGKFDLCILDIMLPKKDGFTLAEEIRKKDQQIPILFLTAKGMKEDKIRAFKIGADDYITKPFSIEELLLRIEVFLKRSRGVDYNHNLFEIGSYTFNYHNLSLTYENKSVSLTQKEADVLRLFCLHKDSLLKREEILTTVWGNDDYFTGRSLDVFITKIRKYLKDDKSILIQNVHGVGFKMKINN